MKKIFTLIVLALFMSLSAMADWSLGNLAYNIKEGATVRMSKVMKSGIKVTFPEVTDNKYSDVTLSAVLIPETGDEILLEGVAGTYKDGVVFKEFGELQNDMKYTFKLTEFIAGEGEEIAWEEGTEPTLTFTVKDVERKLSWNLAQTVTAEEEEAINAIAAQENGRWAISGKGNKSRFQLMTDLNEEILTIDGNTPISMTDGLYITTKAKNLLVSQTTGSYKRLHLAQKGNKVLIPDCNVGDKVAIKFGYVDTKNEHPIQIPNAPCPDATNEAKDSVASGKSVALHVFKVEKEGDLEIIVNNSVITSIEITPFSNEKYKYTVVAKDPEGNVLKTIKTETEGAAGDVVSVPYNYWLMNAEGKVFTYGARGSEFKQDFTLKSDTTFVIEYKDAEISGGVYCMEGEDLVTADSVTVGLITHQNVGVRCSNRAAAYNTKDVELCKLNADTYKIQAALFDNAKGNSIYNFYVGTDSIGLMSTSDNMSLAESSLITVTEDNTPVIWKAGTSESKGLDAIIIYASTDTPEPEPGEGTGINDVTVSGKAKAKKMVRNGQIIIVKGNNEYNVVGSQIK